MVPKKRVSSTVTNKIRRADFLGGLILWALSIAIWLTIAFIGYVAFTF